MKANNRRKVFGDAVDLLMDDIEEKTAAGGLRMLSIKKIRPFHDHPFHLYEGDRLEDMVASVREHGILNPVIVQEIDSGYEMLSGHNRMNAAKLVGLKEIPAIVKTDLSEEEAYVYVIETNLMQRSFSDLLISEKAAVLKARYEKESCQGRRNDIIEEIARMEGKELPATCGHGDQRLNTRDMIGKEYELSGSSVGRLLKLNDLINIVKNIYENTKSKELFPVYGQKALAEYSKVKTNFSNELCDMEKVFICNTLSTVDSAYSRRGLPARGTVIQDATLDKIAEQSNMVALIANGGMGKSMMLRHLFVESMKKYSETGVMPILVELRDYRFAGCDLFNSIVKSVNLFDASFNERAAEKVLRAGKCQILLDGLDEIDPSDIVGFQHMLRDMIKTYPLNQYVITSRECDVAKSIGFRSRLYLMPFDEKQTGDLIDKLVSDDSVKAEITRNLNEGYLNKHGEFASNPMLLTFCIINYPSYQSFYDRPHEFYRSAYDTILSDHDLEKSPLDRVFRSADSRDDFTDVFREFCAVSYVERKFQFNKMTFEAIFKKLKSTKQVANPRIMNKTNFLHDACATACMMYEAKSDILYIDPGFQQFLFAEYNYFAEPEEVEAMGKKLWTVPESEFNGGIAFEMLYELSDEKVEVCLDLPYLDMVFKDKTDEESFNAFLVHGFREIKSAWRSSIML